MSHEQHDHAEHHVIPPRTYYVVFAILMALLVLTWAAAQVDLGPLNIPVALAIATAKTVLIMAYFMHLKFMTPLVKLFAVAGPIWLGIGATLTFADYLTRGWESPETTELETMYPEAGIDRVAPGPEPGGFSISPPAQTLEDPTDTDNQ